MLQAVQLRLNLQQVDPSLQFLALPLSAISPLFRSICSLGSTLGEEAGSIALGPQILEDVLHSVDAGGGVRDAFGRSSDRVSAPARPVGGDGSDQGTEDKG